jgi:hypothetical protein
MNLYFATPKASTSLLGQSAPLSSCSYVHPRLLRRQRLAGRVQAGGGDFQTPPDDKGDADVQDALINMIKFEIGKKQVGLCTFIE